MANNEYEASCVDFADAFSRFIADAKQAGAGFTLTDQELVAELDDKLGFDTDFEAFFAMVRKGYEIKAGGA